MPAWFHDGWYKCEGKKEVELVEGNPGMQIAGQ